MSSSPLNGGSTNNAAMNGFASGMNGGGMTNNSMGYGNMGGIVPSATVSGLRAAMVNGAMGINGVRAGMNHISQSAIGMNHQQQQQQDMGNRLLGGLGSNNNFNNLHFDWKPSP